VGVILQFSMRVEGAYLLKRKVAKRASATCFQKKGEKENPVGPLREQFD